MFRSEGEYLRILRNRLQGTLPREDLEDLLADYSEHFAMGRMDGRKEDEIFRSLGSPEDIARDIRMMYPAKNTADILPCNAGRNKPGR